MKNNVIKSLDGRIEVKYEDVTHVCIAPNLYPLLQYIMLMDDEIVFHHTCFFTNEVVPESVRHQLPCVFFDNFGKTIAKKIQRRLLKLRLRFYKYQDFPFLKTAELYAYDLPYLGLCIGDRSYNALSDAPCWLTLNMQEESVEYQRQQHHAGTLVGKIQKMIFGVPFVHYFGNNDQCKSIYLTEENISPVLQGKEVHIDSLPSLWNNASEDKKHFIMRLFNITFDDIGFLNSRPIMFFSQPLMNDVGLTESEYLELLKKIFNHYPNSNIVVKPHPRDDFDYTNFFPEVIVFNKPINSQLLNLVGVNPKKLVTIASSAIEGYPESIECDYYGTHIHPKIERYFGNNYNPVRKVNYINE